MTDTQKPNQKILRRRSVEAMTGLRRSTLYAYIAAGTFPRPVKLGERSVGWVEAEVEEWIAQVVARREAEAKE